MTGVPTGLPESDISSSLELTSSKRISDESVKKQGSNEKGALEYNYKFYTFLLISLMEVFINYDNGILPVILNSIQDQYNFNSTELGIMGGLICIGFILGAPFIPYIFSKYSCQNSISIGLILDLIAIAVFGLSIHKFMFCISRLASGITRSIFMVFYPVWVDTFAPPKHRNLWMAVIQSGLSVGGAVGYIATSLFSYAGEYGWRYSVMTQALSIGITVALFWMVPKKFIEFDPSRDDIVNLDLCTCEKTVNNPSTTSMETKYATDETNLDDESHFRNNFNVKRSHSLDVVVTPVHPTQQKDISRVYSNFDSSMISSKNPKCNKCFLNNLKLHNEVIKTRSLSSFQKFYLLIKQGVFILFCLSTSAYYFEFTGLQYWTTKLGVSYYNIKEKPLHLIMTIEIVGGPLLGIISGSHLIDQIIHNYPEYPLLVDLTILIWGLIGCLTSVIVLCYQSKMTFILSLFIIYFFGAPLVPVLTLNSVAYLPLNLKPTGASFFMCQYHLLGLTMGAVVPGIAMDVFKNYKAGLYIIYLSGFIGLFLYCTIIYIKWSKNRKAKKSGISSINSTNIKI